LFEAVAFMHEHNVAHMDLKPQNVIIPAEGGRPPSSTLVVGTEDYIAPEVHEGVYKPMLADLYSCGGALEELCACCNSLADRTMLGIARQLMNRDPQARPKM
ncbi:kinase-like domain-containing protein, partial [Lanmaoa asiatica]